MTEHVPATRQPADIERPGRQILSAELLSVGTEIVVGETRDTNSGELAAALTSIGVPVRRLQAIVDDRYLVSAAFRDALARVDLVISTGGLGPTPDDLTREAIADVCGESPSVDAGLERWLRERWTRRGLPFPSSNLKQAWTIPSATPLPNPNGSAPGWWVERPDGRVIVALPGPPLEMRPMWTDHVLPRLRARGAGADGVVRTLRLTGIGESAAAELIGESILRAANPTVATYARAESVDIRIAAVGEEPGAGRPQRSAEDLADDMERHLRGLLDEYVWATGSTTWANAIDAELRATGWRMASVEIGTGGTLAGLLAEAHRLVRSEILRQPDESTDGGQFGDALRAAGADLVALADDARRAAGVDVGLALRAGEQGEDTSAEIALVTPRSRHHVRRTALLGGVQGRIRAAIAATALVASELRHLNAPAQRPSEMNS